MMIAGNTNKGKGWLMIMIPDENVEEKSDTS